MPCEEEGPIKWLFHKASEKGVLPPTSYSVACPLREGDATPWFIQNEMPSHGEREQSTKFGGPCPNSRQPPLCCRLEMEFPPFCPVGGAAGGLAVAAFDTVICRDWCLDSPLESETEIAKLKLPLVVGVPEMVPVLSPS